MGFDDYQCRIERMIDIMSVKTQQALRPHSRRAMGRTPSEKIVEILANRPYVLSYEQLDRILRNLDEFAFSQDDVAAIEELFRARQASRGAGYAFAVHSARW